MFGFPLGRTHFKRFSDLVHAEVCLMKRLRLCEHVLGVEILLSVFTN